MKISLAKAVNDKAVDVAKGLHKENLSLNS